MFFYLNLYIESFNLLCFWLFYIYFVVLLYYLLLKDQNAKRNL